MKPKTLRKAWINTEISAIPDPVSIDLGPIGTYYSGAGGTVNVFGSEHQLILSPPTGNRFYRLKSP